MSVTKEVYFICRTCLQIGTNYFNLFKYFEDGTALSDMLIECINTQAEQNDGLPCHICNECKTKLYSSWAFKSLALEAETKLRSNTKTSRRNDESDIIKEETIVTSNDCNINDKIEDRICDENKTSKTDEGKNVYEYLEESRLINKITLIKDIAGINQLDVVECSNNLDDLEEKALNLGGNKNLIGTEKQKNSCINNDNVAISKIINAKNRLSHKLLRNKRNTKKLSVRNQQRKISRKECNKSYMTGNQQTEEKHSILTCNSCNRTFRSRNYWQRHMGMKKHEGKRHICPICGIECHSPCKLRYHKKSHVNEPRECDICKKVFTDRANLKRHIARHTRTSESKPVCELCGKVYADIFTLRKHLETHNTQNTIPCSVCGKLFKNHRNMSAHLKSHTTHLSHICEYCNKGFKSAKSKRRHILTHTGEKPYPCKLCVKRFGDYGTLYRHMLTHTGETKFVCDKCPYKCRYKQQFDNHLKKHK